MKRLNARVLGHVRFEVLRRSEPLATDVTVIAINAQVQIFVLLPGGLRQIDSAAHQTRIARSVPEHL